MGDQYPSLGPGDCLVQVEVHPVHPTARTAAPNHWDPCPPDLLWLLSHVISQVRFECTGGHEQRLIATYPTRAQETPPTISDATNPHTVWPQSVDGPMGRSPIPSQSRIPEGPSPLTLASGTYNGNFGNLAESIPGCHARAGYKQVGKLMV
ncbi:hypothetical protein EDB86DRAFT_1474318 [Lactarius hatsudake]|nr:hypothetical protein EDB86DRAFT_1474318 [Lactarius hatsudake]